MGFKKHKVAFFKLIKANPTPHHFSLQAKKCLKKKRILQKAEIKKHHNYFWAYEKWIHTV